MKWPTQTHTHTLSAAWAALEVQNTLTPTARYLR